MKLKGKVIKNGFRESGTSKAGNQWERASIVISTEGAYPKSVYITTSKNVEQFASLPIGGVYVFDIDIESREFNGRWYTSVSAWQWTEENPQTNF